MKFIARILSRSGPLLVTAICFLVIGLFLGAAIHAQPVSPAPTSGAVDQVGSPGRQGPALFAKQFYTWYLAGLSRGYVRFASVEFASQIRPWLTPSFGQTYLNDNGSGADPFDLTQDMESDWWNTISVNAIQETSTTAIEKVTFGSVNEFHYSILAHLVFTDKGALVGGHWYLDEVTVVP